MLCFVMPLSEKTQRGERLSRLHHLLRCTAIAFIHSTHAKGMDRETKDLRDHIEEMIPPPPSVAPPDESLFGVPAIDG